MPIEDQGCNATSAILCKSHIRFECPTQHGAFSTAPPEMLCGAWGSNARHATGQTHRHTIPHGDDAEQVQNQFAPAFERNGLIHARKKPRTPPAWAALRKTRDIDKNFEQ